MEKEVAQTKSNYARAVASRYAGAKAAEDDIHAKHDAQEKLAIEVTGHAAQYSHLKDEFDRVRRQLDPIDARIHDLELQMTTGVVNIDFFDRAAPDSARRSHPSKTHTLGLALIIGLMLGCGIALFRDWVDDRLHSADEIQGSLGMPMLGAIPQMAFGINRSLSARRKWRTIHPAKWPRRSVRCERPFISALRAIEIARCW